MENQNPTADAAGVPTFGEVLAAPWLSIWRPEEAGRRFALARKRALLASLLLACVVWCFVAIPVQLWDEMTEWQWVSWERPPVLVDHSLRDVWDDWTEQTPPWLPGMLVGCMLSAALICVVASPLVWPRVFCTGQFRKTLDLSGRAVAATAGPFIVLWQLMSITAILASDRVGQLHTRLTAEQMQSDRWLKDDALSAILVFLTWICGPVWFVWVACAVRGARRVLALPTRKTLTCEGCGYVLIHQSDLGCCTECGTHLDQSLHPERARPDTPWDRRPSLFSFLETTRVALFNPSRLYRLARVCGDDRRSGAFALLHYLLIGLGMFVFTRLYIWRTHYTFTWSWNTPSVEALTFAGWLTALAWLGHRTLGLFAMLVAVRRGWIPAGARAGKIVDYQVVFLWPVLIIGLPWCWATGFPPLMVSRIFAYATTPGQSAWAFVWLSMLITSPVLLTILQQAIYWGPPALLLAFWLRRYALAIRAVKWANY